MNVTTIFISKPGNLYSHFRPLPYQDHQVIALKISKLNFFELEVNVI